MSNTPSVDRAPDPPAEQRQEVDRALKRYGYQQDSLIEILHIAQEVSGYLSGPLLEHIARQLKLPASWVYGVASFYHYFSFKEAAEHTCVVCTGTACYIEGAREILAALGDELGLKVGQTTADGRFALVEFRCPGSCGLAPILVLDGQMLGRETAASVLSKVRALLNANGVKETEV